MIKIKMQREKEEGREAYKIHDFVEAVVPCMEDAVG